MTPFEQLVEVLAIEYYMREHKFTDYHSALRTWKMHEPGYRDGYICTALPTAERLAMLFDLSGDLAAENLRLRARADVTLMPEAQFDMMMKALGDGDG